MERMRSRVNKPSRRPRQSVRYSARYLILVYSKTPERFDPSEIQRLVSQEQGQCTIVCQLQTDASFSYLTFIDFAGKRFQTRNLGLFDIQGHHPRWSHVRSSPWDTLDDMMASGEVIWNGISRDISKEPILQNETPRSASKSASSVQWEHLGSSSSERDILDLCERYVSARQPCSVTTELAKSRDGTEGSCTSRVMDCWRDGYRAGYSDATAYAKRGQKASVVPQSDSESLLFISDFEEPSRQKNHGIEQTVPQDPFDEMLPMNCWSPSNFEPLDWDSPEFSASVFPSN